MAEGIESELKRRVNILEFYGKEAEVNQLKYALKEGIGSKAFDKKGNIKFSSLNLMDMILYYIHTNPSGLSEILEHTQISLDNPIIKQSIIAHLNPDAIGENKVIEIMQSIGVYVTPDEVPGYQEVDNGNFKESNEQDGFNPMELINTFLTNLFDNIFSVSEYILEDELQEAQGFIFSELVSKDAIVSKRIDNKQEIEVTRQGYISSSIFDALSRIGKEVSTDSLNNLKAKTEKFNVNGNDIAEVRNGEEITVNARNDEVSRDLIKEKGAVGIDIAKNANSMIKGSELSAFSTISKAAQQAAQKAKERKSGGSIADLEARLQAQRMQRIAQEFIKNSEHDVLKTIAQYSSAVTIEDEGRSTKNAKSRNQEEVVNDRKVVGEFTKRWAQEQQNNSSQIER